MNTTGRRLRILQVSAILHPRYGGPAAACNHLITGLGRRAVISVVGSGRREDLPTLRKSYPRGAFFPSTFPQRWFRSPGLSHYLQHAPATFDLVHAHMLWDHAVLAAWEFAERAGIPFVLSPHGSVSALWRRYRPHKIIYRLAFLRSILHRAAFVHALNPAEAKACRSFGFRCPIRIIPNGLPLKQYLLTASPQAALSRWPQLEGRRLALYLGRLAPTKGLDILPAAWGAASRREGGRKWSLVIAGPDYRGYRQELERNIHSQAMDSHVLLTGHVDGALKSSLLAAADFFVLPSRSEGFSVALLEAMASRLPCIFTHGCNFPELAAAQGIGCISSSPLALENCLRRFLSYPKRQLEAIGRKGYRLGIVDYTMEKVADQHLEMYREAVARARRNR